MSESEIKSISVYALPGIKVKLMKVIFDSFNITWDQFVSTRRHTPVVCARYCFYYYMNVVKKMPALTLERKTGIDRNSIMHGTSRMENVLSGEYIWPEYGDKIKATVKMMDDVEFENELLDEILEARKRIHRAS